MYNGLAAIHYPKASALGNRRSSLGGIERIVRNEKGPCAQYRTGAGLFWVGTDLLSQGIYLSTIDADGLNDSVRNGKKWGPAAKSTNMSLPRTRRGLSLY
jgi:hypothetical protein